MKIADKELHEKQIIVKAVTMNPLVINSKVSHRGGALLSGFNGKRVIRN